jgi:4-nitrophenyl phosphatase
VLPGVGSALSYLRAKGKTVLFVTNNSTKSRAAYAHKFARLGLRASQDEIIGSAYAAAYYLKHVLQLPADKRAYVVGSGGIVEELTAEGVDAICSSSNGDKHTYASMDEMTLARADPTVGAVIVGFDLDINYRKMATAHAHLRYNQPTPHFIATNGDLTYPHHGLLFPGTGCIVSAIAAPLKDIAHPTVVGKPSKTMLECVMKKYHIDDPNKCIMIGDRLDTDIAFGKMGGMRTLLVLSGKR